MSLRCPPTVDALPNEVAWLVRCRLHESPTRSPGVLAAFRPRRARRARPWELRDPIKLVPHVAVVGGCEQTRKSDNHGQQGHDLPFDVPSAASCARTALLSMHPAGGADAGGCDLDSERPDPPRLQSFRTGGRRSESGGDGGPFARNIEDSVRHRLDQSSPDLRTTTSDSRAISRTGVI